MDQDDDDDTVDMIRQLGGSVCVDRSLSIVPAALSSSSSSSSAPPSSLLSGLWELPPQLLFLLFLVLMVLLWTAFLVLRELQNSNGKNKAGGKNRNANAKDREYDASATRSEAWAAARNLGVLLAVAVFLALLMVMKARAATQRPVSVPLSSLDEAEEKLGLLGGGGGSGGRAGGDGGLIKAPRALWVYQDSEKLKWYRQFFEQVGGAAAALGVPVRNTTRAADLRRRGQPGDLLMVLGKASGGGYGAGCDGPTGDRILRAVRERGLYPVFYEVRCCCFF